ncbi:MAG: cbb3-type cytochrome c oxidase subunit I [Candidatus Brocadiales bacterium]|nr:cbb3-type cytochrome c oxidase subunit I [Candidatus Brocadiales bacterium]
MFAALIFLLQALFGLVAAAQFVWPAFLGDILPFNIVRMLHINALVVWLLAGFMGATYYLLTEEARGRLYSERLADLNFWLFALGVLLVVTGYLYMGFSGHYSPLFSEGREYIEAPRWADVFLVLVFAVFLYNVFMTIRRGIGWNAVTGLLMIGLCGLVFFYLFGMKFFKNMTLDFYFWWWVVHLWVEGAWELIAAAIYALLVIRLFGFPLERAVKYLYIEAGLVLFTGILGTGHHYYWIGTPEYWLTVGGVFSAMEPVPLLIMVFDALNIALKERKIIHPNILAQYWLVVGVVMHFLGAGVWGFIQTLPQANRWTHGTQLTAAHGHLAFFGAYAMLIIAVLYYALPRLKFGNDSFDQRRGFAAFWLMLAGVIGMTLSLTGAGLIQVFMERIMGYPFLEVQGYMGFFYTLRFFFGLVTAVGVFVFFSDVMTLRQRPSLQAHQEPFRRDKRHVESPEEVLVVILRDLWKIQNFGVH